MIFNDDLLMLKIKITFLILSPLVICYFRLILIFDLDHFLSDLPYPQCGGKRKASNGLFRGRQTQIVPDLLSSESSIFEGGKERGVRNSQIA